MVHIRGCLYLMAPTPYTIVFLGKLLVAQLLKRFFACCGTWRFNIVFTRACQWSTICTILWVGHFNINSCFAANIFYYAFLPVMFATSHAHLIHLHLILTVLFVWRVQMLMILVIQFSAASYPLTIQLLRTLLFFS